MTTYATEPHAPADLAAVYAQVQNFYARQVRLLDALDAEEFAATFTEDGVFSPTPTAPAARGRAEIAAALRAAHARKFGTDPVRRRHWFNMLEVRPGADGLLRTHFYSMVLVTRPWDPAPVTAPSSVVEDVLERDATGALLTRERRVTPDHLSF
ncbi:nuclear transport factor 2 family protein [Streptomyces sp. NPDC001941]|uniref:nuclear transport factor 2 family protein n=1 Tax=Streptomyces sp. NPDC001941 TaxID=3154659 RepID=UPI003328201D